MLEASLLIQVIAVENKRLVLCVEDAAERLRSFPVLRYIEDIGDVEIGRRDQVPNLPVMIKKILVERRNPVFLIQSPVQLVNLRFEISRLRCLLIRPSAGCCRLVAQRLRLGLLGSKLLTEPISCVANLFPLVPLRCKLLFNFGRRRT